MIIVKKRKRENYWKKKVYFLCHVISCQGCQGEVWDLAKSLGETRSLQEKSRFSGIFVWKP